MSNMPETLENALCRAEGSHPMSTALVEFSAGNMQSCCAGGDDVSAGASATAIGFGKAGGGGEAKMDACGKAGCS